MDYREFEQTTKMLTVTNIPQEHIDLFIGHYGFEVTTPEKEFVSSKDYPTFRIHYIVSGKLTLFAEGKKYALHRHQCFMLRPDASIGFQTDAADPAAFYWVSFSGNMSNYYAEQMGFSLASPYLAIPTQLQKQLRVAYYRNFTVDADKAELTDAIFIENFMRILQLLYRSSSLARQARKGHARQTKPYIKMALDYINAHYSDSELTLREIARALFVHENYLSRLFKSSMNVSFREYLTQKRIETSVSLMDQGYRSIRKIAELVGYSDALYFSKSFKKLNSCSPREHLRKITEKLEKTDPPPQPLPIRRRLRRQTDGRRDARRHGRETALTQTVCVG